MSLKSTPVAALLLLLLTAQAAFAQRPAKPSASDLYQGIRKLNVLGSVLYVAAHPDDENQRFISYCANEKLFEVTYLSLTRGDGGQNLIGPELRELLGVLRSEELLMARSVDGGKQWFSRANDFGFSKSPEETLRIWDREKVMADVVWAIRQAQPDVIVNRFYHDKKYDTHGHHTASAILSVEAFDLAAIDEAFPEQLPYTKVWQARRQFFNTSWFFYGGKEKFESVDKSNLYPLDLGVYLPLKGKSNSEVAAEARSMHRCQGFGAMSTRGENTDWFDFIKGEKPKNKDMFEGIDVSWNRVPNGAPIGKILKKVEQDFRMDNPAAVVPDLLAAMQLVENLPDGYWKRVKLAQIKDVIRGCLGLYLEATAAEPTVTPGEQAKVHLEAINRSNQSVRLISVSIKPAMYDTTFEVGTLDANKLFALDKVVTIPKDASFTGPYWLQKPYDNGMYDVENQELRGMPETPRLAVAQWTLAVNGVPIQYQTDVAYKIEESAIGEVWRPFEVLPPALVEFTESSYLVMGGKRDVTLRVKSNRDDLHGTALLTVPEGWKAVYTGSGTPDFHLKKKGEEQEFRFALQAQGGPDQAVLRGGVRVGEQTYALRMTPIKYDHIPQQSVLQPAQARAARTDLKVTAKNIGYYMGAGDDIPAGLRQMGCTVSLLQDKDMEVATLQQYDAVVLGIRAYNTKENLKYHQAKLFEYVERGGTLVVQYNNSFDLYVEENAIAPYKLKLSRKRTTDEAAEMRFLLPDHAALNSPNKLNAKDFEGWVQERGLYFPSEWGTEFAALISCNDPEEKPNDGALLVAKHGKGHYVYTSLSFFREFPAGVPGAYRLFANLLSLGSQQAASKPKK
jgi:LmbE family N-acetylglucosaminyl deacetylase